MLEKMRFFSVINEPVEGFQVGIRGALRKKVDMGVVEDVEFFSFLVEERKLGNWKRVLDKLSIRIKDFQPTIILFSHTGKRFFPEEFFSRIIENNSCQPVLAYDERDVYGYIRKPLPQGAMQLAKKMDVIFLVAAGQFADRFRKLECKKVIFLPHVGNTIQFGSSWIPSMKREFDIVLIANFHPSKIPFMSMPGVKERKKLVSVFSKEFGDRFAVFGKGWEWCQANRGPIPFEEQENILRKSWLSIGLDHFSSYEFYFSDRLPIALLSEVVHLTKWNKGLENLFVDNKHCVFFESIEESLQKAHVLLGKPREELLVMGKNGADWARKYFTEDKRMELMIEQMKIIYVEKNKK